ncbi:3359_t:CDS:2 [Acaulospora colombiana]|uniref:3359_t:CDS:1 n=1 Tax=Acaulospora colombiana TaxID=27376 RepID=A0ACA9NBZ0_9GLOM|nr:3359_t:CDS:2 [Acaulospora colombiana]
MPVILEPDGIAKWLDPDVRWNSELAALLKPYEKEVPQEVGKVGNDSPSFIVPIDSSNSIFKLDGLKKEDKGSTSTILKFSPENIKKEEDKNVLFESSGFHVKEEQDDKKLIKLESDSTIPRKRSRYDSDDEDKVEESSSCKLEDGVKKEESSSDEIGPGPRKMLRKEKGSSSPPKKSSKPKNR